MTPLLIWGGAALAYAGFRLWYDGIPRPLEAAEIDELMTRLPATTLADARELANLLGVTYMLKQENGQIDHNGLIVVLDTEGRIVEKFAGITDRKAFLALLKKTARQRR